MDDLVNDILKLFEAARVLRPNMNCDVDRIGSDATDIRWFDIALAIFHVREWRGGGRSIIDSLADNCGERRPAFKF